MPRGVPKTIKFLQGIARARVTTLVGRLQRLRAVMEPAYLAQVGQPLLTPVQDTNIDEVIGTLQHLLEAVDFQRYKGRV